MPVYYSAEAVERLLEELNQADSTRILRLESACQRILSDPYLQDVAVTLMSERNPATSINTPVSACAAAQHTLNLIYRVMDNRGISRKSRRL